MVLAVMMLSLPILAQGMRPCGAVDVLGRGGGIIQSEASAFQFPEFADTNFDRLTVGNDRGLAFGGIWRTTPLAVATNNLIVEKNQDTGECECCGDECQDCCIKVNIDQIKIGDRNALAFGFASATNNVKVVANQQ